MKFIINYRGKRYDAEFDDPFKAYLWAARVFRQNVPKLINSKEFYVIGVKDDARGESQKEC